MGDGVLGIRDGVRVPEVEDEVSEVGDGFPEVRGQGP